MLPYKLGALYPPPHLFCVGTTWISFANDGILTMSCFVLFCFQCIFNKLRTGFRQLKVTSPTGTDTYATPLH